MCETKADLIEVGNRQFNNNAQRLQCPAFNIKQNNQKEDQHRNKGLEQQ